MSDELTYIREAREKGMHRVGAIAIRRTSPGKVRLAVSKCHPNDRFDTHIARNRTLGKLNSEDCSKEFDQNSLEIVNYLKSFHLSFNQIESAQKFISIHATPKAIKAD